MMRSCLGLRVVYLELLLFMSKEWLYGCLGWYLEFRM